MPDRFYQKKKGDLLHEKSNTLAGRVFGRVSDGCVFDCNDPHYGNPGVFQIYFGSITFMVGRDHKISVYLVGIFKCKFMYEEMHID